MKRRTQGKETEINAKLPFVRGLVRSGQRAMRAGKFELPPDPQVVCSSLGEYGHAGLIAPAKNPHLSPGKQLPEKSIC